MRSRQNTLKDRVYAAVFDDIIRGKYHDDGLISEKSLVERFNVSKSPVREALIELCNEGVLRSIPRYGYEVVRLTERDIEDIKQYRLILECELMERYWDMIVPEQVAGLREMLETDYQGPYEDEALNHWARNRKFHLLIASWYHNEYIYQALRSALKTLNRAYAQFYWDRWHTTVFSTGADTHRRLVESLENGSKADALRYLYQDISGFDEPDAAGVEAATGKWYKLLP